MAAASPRPSLAARRLAVFGGSFDPPHRGHLEMAQAAIAARSLDHVLWVPAATPPHKPGRRLASGAERVRMLELLLGVRAAHSIWTAELERGGLSYTVDTLRALVEVEAIAGLARAIVLPRADPDGEARRALAAMPPALARWVEEGRLDVPPIEVSSTEVRRRLTDLQHRRSRPGCACSFTSPFATSR